MNSKELLNYQAAPNSLADRNILITGASDGIGAALAKECARLGATVILMGRSKRKLAAVYDSIEAAGGEQAAIIPLDFKRANVESYEELAAGLESEFGHLDGLAHVAGILGDRATIEHYPTMTWHEVIHVNLSSVFMLTRALTPLLRTAEDPSVVFASSSVGRTGRAHWGAYAVSKFGVEGLMQTYADENDISNGIRANSVNPGATRTGMRAAAYPAEDSDAVTPPDKVLAPFVFCLSPDSRGITGQAFDSQPA